MPLFLLSFSFSAIARNFEAMQIHYMTPFALDKNLGAGYNRCFELVKKQEDYICFVDADAMFLTPDYGSQLFEIVKKNPGAGMFTCLTNRVANKMQLYKGKVSEDPDIRNHRRIAMSLQMSHRHTLKRVRRPVSGVLMMVQKKVWLSHRFPNGLLGVDNTFTQRLLDAGLPVYVMMGVYVFHYYRFVEGIKYKKHLQ